MVPGAISKKNGAIGKAGGFAVFPNYETGHKAHLDCLKTTYNDKSLKDMIADYAPRHENKTARYLRFLRKKVGVNDDKKIKNFTADEFEKLWKAIEQMEGQHEGEIKECIEKIKEDKPVKNKIIGVRKNKKGTIITYQIETIGWVSKSLGIELTRQQKVDAVVAHSRRGALYLRTRPDRSTSNNLKAMG